MPNGPDIILPILIITIIALGNFNFVFYQEGSSKVTRRIPLLVEEIIAVSHQV